MALTKISTAMISQDAASVDLNIDAGTLYIDSTNNRVGVANTSPATALDVTGTITADTIKLGDNERVQIGDGQDFQFYHDGSNSYILATGGSGSLITRADVFGVQDSSNINMIEAASTTGVVTLYYNTGSTSAARLATSSTGVSITGNLTTTGYIAGPATFTIDPAAVGDNTGTVVIAGNLQVDGTTTTINSTTVNVDDLNIQLATGAANAAAANGAGITVDGASATITYDGTNDEWDFNKDVNVTGTLTASGGSSNNDSTANILTLNASEHARLVVDTSSTGGHRATLALKSNNNETQLTTTGSASFLNVASGSLTVDVPGDIVLDADTDGRIFFFDGGTEYGNVGKSSNSLVLKSAISDGDILIQGNDGGSTITALTLDMSNAGQAIFNKGAQFSDHIYLGDNDHLVLGGGDDLRLFHDGSNSYIQSTTGNFNITTAGGNEFALTAVNDGAVTLYYNGSAKIATTSTGIDVTGTVTATEFDLPSGGMLDWANGDARIVEGLVNNYSLSFQTYDGSNITTALRLDGNNSASFAGTVKLDSELQFLRGGSSYTNYIRANNYPSQGYSSSNQKYWIEYGAQGGHHFVLNTDGGSGAGENAYDHFTIWQGDHDGDRLLYVSNAGNMTLAGNIALNSKDISGIDQLKLARTNTASTGLDYDAINISYSGSWSGNTNTIAGINVTDSTTYTQTVGRFGVTYNGSSGEFVVTNLYNGSYGGSGDVFKVNSTRATFTGVLSSELNGNNTTGGNIVLGATGNNATKWSSISQRQYNNSTETEGFSLITGATDSTNNYVTIGGGLDEQNAATSVNIKVASNNSTRNGTEILRVNSSGVIINSTSNSAIYINGNGGGLTFTGGNNRIYFSGYRALEGDTSGGTLQIGEQYDRYTTYGPIQQNTTNTGTRFYTGLATGSYYTTTGYAILQTNIPGHNVSGNGNMFSISIEGFGYDFDYWGIIDFNIGCYSGEGNFYNASYSGSNIPFEWTNEIYIATNSSTGKLAFIFGKSNTIQRAEIACTKFVQGFANVVASYSSGWTFTSATNTNAYSNITRVHPRLSQYPYFAANSSSGISISGGSWSKISDDMNNEQYDSHANYDASNGRFTPKVKGWYQFNFGGWANTSNTSSSRYAIAFAKNGSLNFISGGNYSNADTPLDGASKLIYLNGTTDYVELWAFSSIASTWGGSTHYVYWEGFWVRS